MIKNIATKPRSSPEYGRNSEVLSSLGRKSAHTEYQIKMIQPKIKTKCQYPIMPPNYDFEI